MPRARDIAIEESGLGQDAAVSAHIEAAASAPDTEGRIRTGKLAGLTMGAAMLTLAWPVMVESLLQALVGMVDTILAAGASEAAADAIGATSYFIWVVQIIASALGVGATAVVSRAIGKGRTAVAGAVVGQTVIISAVAGTGMMLIVRACAPLVPGWLNLSPEAATAARDYLLIVSWSVPMSVLIAGGIACCRAAGDSVSPMLVMGGVNVVNTVLSFLLSGVDIAVSRLSPDGVVEKSVLVPQPLEIDMGVRGIALGTLAGWLVGAVLILAVLVRGTHGLKLRARRLRPHWHTLRRLIRLALPNAIGMFAMWFGNCLALLMVGWMRTPGFLGAHIVAVRIEAFSFLPGFAMGAAAATLAGQYLGAGRPDLARRAVTRCTLITAAFMAVGGVLLVLLPRPIVGLFSQQEAHLTITPQLLVVTGFIQPIFGSVIVMRTGMLGAGDTRVVMHLTWLCIFGLRLPLAWLCCGVELPMPGGGVIPNPAPLQSWFGLHPLAGFWVGLCIEILLRQAIFFARYRGDAWLKIRV